MIACRTNDGPHVLDRLDRFWAPTMLRARLPRLIFVVMWDFKRRSRHLTERARLSEQIAQDIGAGNRRAADLVLYSNLFLRYDSNTDLQWRVPATVMTVESFVYLGLVTVAHNDTARWCLAILGALLAVIGAASMRRIELTALADRALLDIYEHELDFGLPVLPHRMRFNRRLEELRRLQTASGEIAVDAKFPHGVFYGTSKQNLAGRLVVWMDRQFVKFHPRLPGSSSWSLQGLAH